MNFNTRWENVNQICLGFGHEVRQARPRRFLAPLQRLCRRRIPNHFPLPLPTCRRGEGPEGGIKATARHAASRWWRGRAFGPEGRLLAPWSESQHFLSLRKMVVRGVPEGDEQRPKSPREPLPESAVYAWAGDYTYEQGGEENSSRTLYKECARRGKRAWHIVLHPKGFATAALY